MSSRNLLSAAALSLLFVGAGCASSVSVNGNADVNREEPVACTMEAKQCPDGSYVGRTGPKCEFAPCPGGADGGVNVNIQAY